MKIHFGFQAVTARDGDADVLPLETEIVAQFRVAVREDRGQELDFPDGIRRHRGAEQVQRNLEKTSARRYREAREMGLIDF